MAASPSGRMPQLIVLVGAPGSGKTQWVETFIAARPHMKWNVLAQSAFHTASSDGAQAFSRFQQSVRDAFTARNHIVADGTFFTEESRKWILSLARDARYLVKEAVIISAEPEVALHRYMKNEQARMLRGFPAFHYAEEDIRRAIAAVEIQPPRTAEGFSGIFDGKPGGNKQARADVMALACQGGAIPLAMF